MFCLPTIHDSNITDDSGFHHKHITQYLQELKLWKFEDFGWQHN